MLALGMPSPPLPLCLPCLMEKVAEEPKAALPKAPLRCDCWAWCFPRRPQRKQRLPELASWRRAPWPEARPGAGFGRTRPNPLTQDVRLPCGLLPSQVSELLDRDITPDDYEMLLQLDESLARPTADRAAVEGLATLESEDFLGKSCAVCLLAFEPKDSVAVLQCKHPFHAHCISKWLLERNRWCPLCGGEAAPPA